MADPANTGIGANGTEGNSGDPLRRSGTARTPEVAVFLSAGIPVADHSHLVVRREPIYQVRVDNPVPPVTNTRLFRMARCSLDAHYAIAA